LRAIARTLPLIESLRAQGHEVDTLNLGGGFMANYGQAGVIERSWGDYAGPIEQALRPFLAAGGRCLIEPGRTISANAGVLLTRVLYTKRSGDRNVVVVDTGMMHLARPALYDAEHFIWPVKVAPNHTPSVRDPRARRPDFELYDVVGPICESTDRLGEARALPPLARDDLLAVFSTGAYGMVMASQYNAVPRPPELLVSGGEATLIRRRETYQDLIAAELEPRPI
jgi:diaminopimelate decarboxylase